MKLSIPSRWDNELLKKQLEIIKGQFAVYDSLKIIGPFGSGRSNAYLPDVTIEQAIKYIELCKENKVEFNYLLNAPTIENIQNLIVLGLDKQLELIASLNPDSITISERSLMEYFHAKYPSIPINISTIAAVNTPEQLRAYLHLPIRKVVIPHQLNRKMKEIERLVDFATKYNIKVEIIANETCLHDCNRRRQHYLSDAQPKYFKKACSEQSKCNQTKVLNPYLLLMSGWIRPEDIKFYENIGIEHFKLSCRTKPSDWHPEIVKAYNERSYNGNIIRLFGITPPGLAIAPHELFFLDNNALDGFLEEFLNSLDKENFCKEKIAVLFRNDKFRIDSLHGGRHTVKNNELKLIAKGDYLQ